MQLHWAQEEALEAVESKISKGFKKIYIDMPTRSGKSGVFLGMLEKLAKEGKLPPTTIVTDRKKLIRNIMRDATDFAPTLMRNGFIQAHTSKSLQKASAMPLVRVMSYPGRTQAILDGTLKPEDEQFIIEDEGQHMLSELRQDTHNRNPDAIHLACTASPEYSVEKGLPQAGYELAYHLSRQRAIDGELNAQTRSVIVEMQNIKGSLDDVSSEKGNLRPEELEKLVAQTAVMENLGEFMEHWHSPVDPRPIHQRNGFIFCNSIADAVATADYLNKRFGLGTCGAVWGAMNPTEQENVIQAHEEGAVKYLASADFAIEGMGNESHDVVLNKTPSTSAVVVKQRGGRVTGYDEFNPDKEALIADFMYPYQRTEQLTYGDAVGGYLMTKANKVSISNGQANEPDTNPTPMIDGMRIHATPKIVETYLRSRDAKRKEAMHWRLNAYSFNIRNHMIGSGLLSLEAVWHEVQKFVKEHDFNKGLSVKVDSVAKNRLKKLMTGEISYEHTKYRSYSPTAIALASAFGTHPNRLFGALDSAKPLPPYEFKKSELSFHEDDLAMPITETEVRPELGGDFSFEDDGYDASVDEWIDDIEDVERVTAEDAVYRRELQSRVSRLLETIPARQERAIRAYMGFDCLDGEGRTLSEVSSVFGVTGNRIRELNDKSIRILNHPSRNAAILLNPEEFCSEIFKNATRLQRTDLMNKEQNKSQENKEHLRINSRIDALDKNVIADSVKNARHDEITGALLRLCTNSSLG
jgi:superfamily II DNA or RNA helicase